jgi:hypothetical protein
MNSKQIAWRLLEHCSLVSSPALTSIFAASKEGWGVMPHLPLPLNSGRSSMGKNVQLLFSEINSQASLKRFIVKIGGLCELRTLGCVSINTDELIEINSDSNLPSPLVHRIFRGGLILSSPDHAFPWMPPKITLYILCYSVLRPPKVREPNGALRDYLNQEPTLPLLGLDSARLVPSCHEAHGKCLMCAAKAFKPYIAGNRSGDNVKAHLRPHFIPPVRKFGPVVLSLGFGRSQRRADCLSDAISSTRQFLAKHRLRVEVVPRIPPKPCYSSLRDSCYVARLPVQTRSREMMKQNQIRYSSVNKSKTTAAHTITNCTRNYFSVSGHLKSTAAQNRSHFLTH